MGRLATRTNVLGTFTVGYDGNTTRVASVTGTNGPQRIFTYLNEAGDHQLAEILNKTGDTTLSRFGYSYNGANQIISWSQQAGADSSTAKVYSFKYDQASRLTSALLQTAGVPQSVIHRYSYAYDPAGNRTSEQIDGVVTSALYNFDNELRSQAAGGSIAVAGTTDEAATVSINGQAVPSGGTSFEGQAVVAGGDTSNFTVAAKDGSGNVRTNTYSVKVSGATGTLQYDLGGNLIADATRTYEWDAENRLTAVVKGTYRSEFSYDGLGRRVEIIEKDNGAVTSDKKYLWVGGMIAEERNSDGSTTTKRFFDQGFQDAVPATPVPYFYTKDHVGSIREVVNAAGEVKARYDYDPWGRRVADISNRIDADFGFTGYLEHQPSGLKLAMFRAYDANLGRFISRDPIGLDGGLNLYAYGNDDPINEVDLLGDTVLRCEKKLQDFQSLPDWSMFKHHSLCVAPGPGPHPQQKKWQCGGDEPDPNAAWVTKVFTAVPGHAEDSEDAAFRPKNCTTEVDPGPNVDAGAFDQCVADRLKSSKRPPYSTLLPVVLPFLPVDNCQTWPAGVIATCQQQCPKHSSPPVSPAPQPPPAPTRSPGGL